MHIAILTVSDTRSAATDKSGDTLAGLAENDGHVVCARAIVKDSVVEIRQYLAAWIQNPGIQVVISTGGTGLSERDVTIEAHKALYEKDIDGFHVLFHMISYRKIGMSTIQSRACAGVANNTCLFALPGSPSACQDAWSEIIGRQLNPQTRPCNFCNILWPDHQ